MITPTTNERKCIKKSMYVWSGVDVQDIAQYLGIVMWMGIIGLPEMRMYWARNMTFSLCAFPQMMSRRRFEAIQKYFRSFNKRAIPKGNPDKLMIIRPVLDFIIDKMSFPLCTPKKSFHSTREC